MTKYTLTPKKLQQKDF